MNKLNGVIWGFVLIIIGIVFGLNALDITNINLFFEGWWTLFIIIPSFMDLFEKEDKTGSIIGLMIGIILLLSCRKIINFAVIWKLLFPTILCLIGISLIFKDSINSKVKKEIQKLQKKNKKSDLKEYTATFGSQDIDLTNETFEGCNLSSVFGGITCDLRESTIKNNSVINISSIFSGVTVYVPKDVNVKITSTPVFGGVSNEKRKKTKDSDITLYINATCVFGGVEIK